MTNAPYLLPKARGGYRMGHGQIIDHMFMDGLEDAYDKGRLMGTFAEKIAPRPSSSHVLSRTPTRSPRWSAPRKQSPTAISPARSQP